MSVGAQFLSAICVAAVDDCGTFVNDATAASRRTDYGRAAGLAFSAPSKVDRTQDAGSPPDCSGAAVVHAAAAARNSSPTRRRSTCVSVYTSGGRAGTEQNDDPKSTQLREAFHFEPLSQNIVANHPTTYYLDPAKNQSKTETATRVFATTLLASGAMNQSFLLHVATRL